MNPRYGCHNRLPYVVAYKATGGRNFISTVGKAKCQFTRSDLGKDDVRCTDCGWTPGGRLDVLEKRA